MIGAGSASDGGDGMAERDIRKRAARAIVAVAILVAAVSRVAVAASAHDPPLIDPDLTAMAEPVRRGIEAYRKLVDELAPAAAAGGEGVERARLAQAYGQLGQLYHAHAQTEAALAAYANARRIEPRSHRWAYYLGILEQTSGDLGAARRDLEAALALAPDDAPTLLRLGELALAQRRLDDAEGFFRRVLERESDAAAAWFGLGQVAAERRDPTAAIDAFERVLVLQPAASIAHYPLALAYRDRGDAQRAREHLALRGETAVQTRDPLVRELTTLSKLSALQVVLSQAADRTVGARDLVGFALGQLATVDGAVDYLRAAIARDATEQSALDAFARARVLVVVGALLVEREQVEDAARAFEEALALDSDSTEAAIRLGNLLGRERKLDQALARYDAVLAMEPGNAEALLGRADALALSGRDREALAVLERLEASAPAQGRIVLRTAAAMERLERADDALAHYREALSIAANDAQSATAQAGIGRLLAARGENDAAIEALSAAARLAPADGGARLDLAALEARLGRFADAAAHYGEAVALDGDSEAARVGEASALLLARQWVQARARLEGGVRMLPSSVTLRHLLARLLASCPDRSLRDGARAVALAEDLARSGASPAIRETLAMSLAETGRFERASALQAEIAADDPASRLAANLERYRRGERCCASDDPLLLLP